MLAQIELEDIWFSKTGKIFKLNFFIEVLHGSHVAWQEQ